MSTDQRSCFCGGCASCMIWRACDERDDALAKNAKLRAEAVQKLDSVSQERDKWKAIAQKYGDHVLESIHKVLDPIGGLCEAHKKAPTQKMPCALCLDFQLSEALKAISAIAPYCKVKYGMDEAAVNEIERLSYTEKRYREGDGHPCVAAEECPCSLCGRVMEGS